MIFFVARFGTNPSASEIDSADTLSPLTLVYGDTREEGGFWIEDPNLISIDSEGSTVGRNVWVDGNQGVRAGRNGENPITGEVSHFIAGVLDPEIRVREGECRARGKIVVLRTERPLSADRT